VTLIAVGALKGAPGVTTVAWSLAAALAERCPVLLVEADTNGGAVAARTARPVDPGLRSLAVAARRTPVTPELVEGHAQRIGRLGVVMADPSAASVRTALAELSTLGEVAAAQPDVWVADVGRLTEGHSLAAAAQLLVVVTSAAPAELAATWAWLHAGGDGRPVVVVPASGEPGQLAADLGVTVLAAGAPLDPPSVGLLHAGLALDDKRLHRRDLTRWSRWASQVLLVAATQEPAAR
jgi:MinD-like ATPase involved in chromosome partitioning or flagellar assembly